MKYQRPVITKNLRDYLEVFTKYRYLRTSFVSALLPHHGTEVHKNLRNRMVNHGLFSRPDEQRNFYDAFYASRVHELTDRGRKLAAQLEIFPDVVTGQSLGPYKHAMGICDFLASLEIACRQEGLTFIPWGEIMRHGALNEEGFALRSGPDDRIIPDSVFGIRYPNGNETYFLHEHERTDPIERKTAGNSLKKKLEAYDRMFQEGGDRFLNLPDGKRPWLIVTTVSKTRSEHQCEMAEKVIGPNQHVLFTAIPDQLTDRKAPHPFPEILTTPLRRPGFPSTPLYDRERGERMKRDATEMDTEIALRS